MPSWSRQGGSKMAAGGSWKDDESLAEELQKYVFKHFHRSEILDFMRRDYQSYNWSIATLDRRLRLFDIFDTGNRRREQTAGCRKQEAVAGCRLRVAGCL